MAVGIGTALLFTGCAGGPADRDRAGEGEATVAADRRSVPGAGLAVSRSDVSGIPDSPLESGAVIFVGGTRTPELAAATGVDLADPGRLPHTSFELDADRAAEFTAAVAAIDSGGRFPVEVGGGRYLVCLADILPDHPAGPPYVVVGCAFVDLSGPGSPGLTMSFGEGGVEATPG